MAEEMRIVLRNYGKIDPLKIDDYIAAGGYKSLEKARSMKQTEVIEEVKKSNLRGRGGAGFNAGMKWKARRRNACGVEGERLPGNDRHRSFAKGDFIGHEDRAG